MTLETTLAALTDSQLEAYYAEASAAYYAAKGFARKGDLRTAFKASSRERSRRAWNRTPKAVRAEQTLYSIQQGDPDWYEAGDWLAMTSWVNGEMGALEACEAHGVSLDDQ